jgi:hypothetical protein
MSSTAAPAVNDADLAASGAPIEKPQPATREARRVSLASWIDPAGIGALSRSSTPEQVEAALLRLRALLPATLDNTSRETLCVELRRRLREQDAPHTAAMINAALAPLPRTTTEPDRGRPSQATRLVDLAVAAGVELWHSPAGDPHITIPIAHQNEHHQHEHHHHHHEHHRLTTRAVRDWLGRRHYAETGAAPSTQAIQAALLVLAGKARHEGRTHETAVRVAGYGGALYLDLGDPTWRAVEITPAGWWIEARPPVRMLRSRGMLALPVPTSGGSIDMLRELVHVASDDDYRLLVGWLVGALRPAGPYPILSLVGEQGTGKSTAARIKRRLIDPHVAELRAEPRVIDDVMIAAARSRIVALDNLSHLAPWLSDALCRLSTGGALTKRELYTDDDETIIEAMRPVIVTSITDIVTRGDLLDRAIVIALQTLPGAQRVTEAELWCRYEAAAPAILGALLDAVVVALARERMTTIAELPRMADWARWVTAAEPALGWPGTSILDAYRAMRGTAIEVTLEGDPLAAAIRHLVIPEGHPALPWEGTATDLLRAITPDGRTPRGWPESGRGMSAALRRLAPGLRHVGIEIDYRRVGHDRDRVVHIDSRKYPIRPAAQSASSGASDLLGYLADSPADDCPSLTEPSADRSQDRPQTIPLSEREIPADDRYADDADGRILPSLHAARRDPWAHLPQPPGSLEAAAAVEARLANRRTGGKT